MLSAIVQESFILKQQINSHWFELPLNAYISLELCLDFLLSASIFWLLPFFFY